MQVLYAVCNFGESCLLSDICRLSGTSKQTINSALRKLEADGYIKLKIQTGLKKIVMLTSSGKVLAEQTAGKIVQIENDILSSWSDKDREKYLELSERYLIALKEKADREIP